MASELEAGAQVRCAHCGVPIVRTEYMVEIDGRCYPCPSCAWLAANPELGLRLRRGGGMVQTCGLCQAPIVFSEIMVNQDGQTYCCPNNALVARSGGGRNLTTVAGAAAGSTAGGSAAE